jgi:ribosomal protein L10
MPEIDGVRTEVLKHGARFTVVKNTLTKRAAEEAGVPELVELLDGPTAIAFVGDGDMVGVAKALNDTARRTRILSLRGGILQGKPMSARAGTRPRIAPTCGGAARPGAWGDRCSP